jgi:hypothetical protein
MQHGQGFSDLAGFLALFKIDDESNPRSGSQGEIALGCVLQRILQKYYRAGIL